MDTTTLYVMLAAAGIGVLLFTARYWVESNTSDMGTMSRQWLVENDQTRP
jgi:hypothetical protein